MCESAGKLDNKDYILYIDIVKSTSLTTDKRNNVNNKIYTDIINYISKHWQGNNFENDKLGNFYINFTGDGYVVVVNSNMIKKNDFITMSKNIYIETIKEYSTYIRLAASCGHNDWVELKINSGNLVPCGEGIIDCSRLLSAANYANIIYSKSLVNSDELDFLYPAFYHDVKKIKTKDLDSKEQHKIIEVYNIYSLGSNIDYGNCLYDSSFSAYNTLSELVCSKFHSEYKETLNRILKNEGSQFKISVLLKHTPGERIVYMALPGRLYMNGKSISKAVSSKMIFEYDKYKQEGCPGISAETLQPCVVANLEDISIEGKKYKDYLDNLKNVYLSHEKVKAMSCYDGKLPSCFISIPYIPNNEKENKDYLPEIILSIDTEKKIAKNNEELLEKAKEIQKHFTDFIMDLALLGITKQ